MDEIWEKYERWLIREFPEDADALNPGASEEVITALEQTLGVNLPADYRATLRRHNGDPGIGLWSDEFFSTAEVLSNSKVMTRLLEEEDHLATFKSVSFPPDAVKPVWWNPHWVPITGDGSGNLTCIDLDPGAAGTSGQVIDFDHETVERSVLASSFREWVEEYVRSVTAGEYTYDDELGRLVEKDEPKEYEQLVSSRRTRLDRTATVEPRLPIWLIVAVIVIAALMVWVIWG